MTSFKNRLVDNLPDAYAKEIESNNYKLFQIIEREFEKRARDNQALLDILDLDNCTGKTLDLYGEMFKQPRGQATDSQYRYMIRAKIARYHTKSDYESIADAVCLTFNCEYSEFRMEETNSGIKITMLPMKAIVSAGLTINQTISLIKGLIPAGVAFESAEFEGTFEFGATAYEYDENAGFSNDEGSIGGYFGYAGEFESETILPV